MIGWLRRVFRRERLLLDGGPMDGWFVPPRAPVLRRSWSKDGRYRKAGRDADGIKRARWEAAE